MSKRDNTSRDDEHHAGISCSKQSTTKSYVNPYARNNVTTTTATSTVFNSPSIEANGGKTTKGDGDDFDEYGDGSWCYDSEVLPLMLKSTTKKQPKNTTTTTSMSTATKQTHYSSSSVLDDTSVHRTLFGSSSNTTNSNTTNQQQQQQHNSVSSTSSSLSSKMTSCSNTSNNNGNSNETTKLGNKKGNVKGKTDDKAERSSSNNGSKKRKSKGSNMSIDESDKEYGQPTLTQMGREKNYGTTTGTIFGVVEFDGRHFIAGDVFFRNPDPDKPDDILNNAFVVIAKIKTKTSCAIIENEFYKRLEDTYIGFEEATNVCAGSQKYVKCILTPSCDNNGNTNNISTSLNSLGERRDPNKEGPIEYDYDYYNDTNSKEFCCYKSVVTTDVNNQAITALLASLDEGKPTVLNLYAGGGGKNS
jgi:hypothetical protein